MCVHENAYYRGYTCGARAHPRRLFINSDFDIQSRLHGG